MTTLQMQFYEINGKMVTKIDNLTRGDANKNEIAIANAFENYVKDILRDSYNGIDIEDIPQREITK